MAVIVSHFTAIARPASPARGWRRAAAPWAQRQAAIGRENTGVVYGWIGASHQLGASLAAFGAGAIRTEFGNYRLAFWMAGGLCVLAGQSFLSIGRRALSGRVALPATA